MNYNDLIYIVPAALLAITGHEFAHGYVSWKMGDPTPKEDGRLSLNPFSSFGCDGNTLPDPVPLWMGKTCANQFLVLQRPEKRRLLYGPGGTGRQFYHGLYRAVWNGSDL